MKHVYLFGLVGVGMLGCGGGDPHEPELSTREATGDECAAGGTVLQLNGEAPKGQEQAVRDAADLIRAKTQITVPS